jgi:lysophospholipase L1-like esterase
MLECLILGDSIAVGTHQFMPQCAAYAKGGWNTWQWNREYLKNDLTANVVIISLGSNDHKHINTEKELVALRAKVTAKRVYWVLPAGNLKASEVNIQWIQALVRDIAYKNGDIVLPINGLQKDGIHPSWSGYRDIAAKAK